MVRELTRFDDLNLPKYGLRDAEKHFEKVQLSYSCFNDFVICTANSGSAQTDIRNINE